MLVNTWQGFSIAFVCGPPGSGKSWIMTRDVIRRLVDGDGRIVTNLPLNVEEVSAEVAKARKCDPEEVVARIKLIDRDTLRQWRTPEKVELEGKLVTVVHGPWEWNDEFCKGADFILDECHIYCPKTGLGATQFVKPWQDYLGEARHRGWSRLVFVTQDESKVGAPISTHADVRYELTNSERLRDPWLKIPLGHWYELKASVTRDYLSKIALIEYRRRNGKLQAVHREGVTLDPYWFKFYRSHEAAGGGTGEGAIDRPKREFEKRPALFVKRENGRKVRPVWQWFLLLHWWRFALASLVVSFAAWFLVGGGLTQAPGIFKWLTGIGPRSLAAKSQATSPPGVPADELPADLKVPEMAEKPNATENSLDFANSQLLRKLPSAMAAVPPEERKVIERAIKLATAEIRSREQAIRKLEAEAAAIAAKEAEPPEEPLPVVQAFVGWDAVVVQGRKVKEGETILLEGGKRRVKIRKIDRAERIVYLEDSRIMRFGVVDAHGMQVPGGVPLRGVPTPAAASVSTGVQPVGQSAEGQPGQGPAGPEKSVVVRRSNADGRVLAPAGGRDGQ